MAVRHKSSIKRARQAVKRRHKNRIKRDQIKNVIKGVLTAKDAKAAQDGLKTAEKVISRMAAKGIMKKNTAARRISRLARSANKAAKAVAPTKTETAAS